MKLRESPEDFVVDELPLYEPSGEGEHAYLFVEKRNKTTEQVARALAREADVPSRDIGYAGRKDRAAVTRQWFSVPGLALDRISAIEGDGFEVLEARLHGHKLRTGALRGNRFEITVRELTEDQCAAAPARLAALIEHGMPNRFGEQRFGRDGDNAARGLEILAGGKRGDKRAARFAISALQSAVFNEWLDAREPALDELETGDVAWIHESGACFVVEDLEREAPRAASFEISPAGPLPGTRLLDAKGVPGERERALFERFGLPNPLQAPRGIRVRGARRPARIRPEAASCVARGRDVLTIAFILPPGSYATVLMDALFTEAPDGA